MFRMEFQSLDAVEEEEDRTRTYSRNAVGTRGTSVYEQYRQRNGTECSPPKIYEGRVGKFGKMQRVVSSNEAVSNLPPIPIMRALSLNSATSIPKDWVEVDLIDFSDPPKSAPASSTTQENQKSELMAGEQEVIRELVKPFAESVHLTAPAEPVIRDLLSNGVEETVETEAVSAGSEGLQVRTDSLRSSSSSNNSNSARSECSDTESSSAGGERVHLKDEEKGSPATRSVNKAFNKFMLKRNKPSVSEAKFVKPWDEPLLLAHEQVKLDRKAQKEAKLEAKRLAEEDKREAEKQQRELLELANPVPESSLKHQKDYGFSKGIHKLFHIHGAGSHSNSPRDPSPREGMSHTDVRESKLVMPRVGMFEAGMPATSPSHTDVALSQIRSGPRPAAKSDLTFATVESNQRDVQPWTMEEYMAHNARLGEWEKRADDEEFGGIEGNQLLNQNFDNNALDDFDSDSD